MIQPLPAHELADELERQILDRSKVRTSIMIVGGPATGKSTVLGLLADRADARGWPVIRVSPPSGELDGPANALAQGAAGVREQGDQGALDPVYDPRVAFERKLEVFGAELGKAQDSVILVDMPDSWARPNRLANDGGAFAFWGHSVVREVLSRHNGHRVVVASRDHLDSDQLAATFELRSEGGPELLASITWGACGASAAKVHAMVPEAHLESLTPLDVRLAVALEALGLDSVLLRSACRGGWPELRRMFEGQVRRHRWLREAFFVLSHARMSVGEQLLDPLLSICEGPDQSLSRDVLTGALLMRERGGFVFHQRFHAIDPGIEPSRANELADTTHRQLARAWSAKANPQTWRGVIAWWESLHHWAEVGDEQHLEHVPDISMWTTLGRRRSLRGDYVAAVRAFSRAVQLQPEDSYAQHYLAYNLEHLGERRDDAERAYTKAVTLDRANPWWNRRLVQALQRRGKIDLAWNAWLTTLANIEEAGEPSEWLQHHLHKGVCRGFLERGQLGLAADVINAIPRGQWVPEIAELWDIVRHRQEALSLEASVFPEDLSFDDRWNGPHLGDDEPPHSWFPGRVIAVSDQEVELEFAEPPTDDEEPKILGLSLSLDDFRAQAELSGRARPRVDQFLELHVYADDLQRIFLHPSYSVRRPPGKPGRPPIDLLSAFRP